MNVSCCSFVHILHILHLFVYELKRSLLIAQIHFYAFISCIKKRIKKYKKSLLLKSHCYALLWYIQGTSPSDIFTRCVFPLSPTFLHPLVTRIDMCSSEALTVILLTTCFLAWLSFYINLPFVASILLFHFVIFFVSFWKLKTYSVFMPLHTWQRWRQISRIICCVDMW